MRNFAGPLALALLTAPILAQDQPFDAAAFRAELIDSLSWREVGPYRGGRSCAVTGIPQDRDTYYFGSCGGGVWKTRDGGRSWDNVSDGFFGGSVGCVAVSEWDPNVVWVGTGEKTVRGNVSHGDGVYRSTDAGRTWQHVGLKDSRHIARIRIHPRDPDTAWAAVMGHLFGSNTERGVFKTTDGGQTWNKVLYVSSEAGAVDLCLDPTNPRILYASTWKILRTPYSLESGGEGSGLWKSTDSGETWTELTHNDGLPGGTWGISGITVSPSDPDNLYCIVENDQGGVFRSRDAGKTWRKVSDDRSLRQRAWYYSRIYADPQDADVVYVLNVAFWRSKNGGEDFERIGTPHGDNHDLWIDPTDPARMIESNDGGANVSTDGGANWTDQDNQPTAQMYRVSLDDDFPYRLLGGQQDNSTVRIKSRNPDGGSIGIRDWSPTAGGESGHVVAQPGHPEIVIGGSYGGYLQLENHATGESRSIHVWPDSVMGHGTAELRYRFQWNFPIFFSPHDPDTLYCAAQVLFRSKDLGQSWEQISPDLTRDDKSMQGPSGGPITKDNTGVEYYCTIFAACESPAEEGVLWCGSDDGLVHISRDHGASWKNVTPPGMPEWAMVNSIDAHPSKPGVLYVAATRYKRDDFEPYLFATYDHGETWSDITGRGILEDHFTRVVRCDPEVNGLLYAGTERGVYVSFDGGEVWQSLQGDLPMVPVTDLAVRDDELIAATQGRGYWILNGLWALRETATNPTAPVSVFEPAPIWRTSMRGGGRRSRGGAGSNPPGGVEFRWVGKEGVSPVIEIRDDQGEVIQRLVGSKAEGVDGDDPRTAKVLPEGAGIQSYVWNPSWPGARSFPGMVLWNSSLGGPTVAPGVYAAEVSLGEATTQVFVEVRPDPRVSSTLDDTLAQVAFRRQVVAKLDAIHSHIRELRQVREDLRSVKSRTEDLADRDPEEVAAFTATVDAALDRLKKAEETLYQTKSQSRQDPLNFPVRLNDKLAALNRSSGAFRPTDQEQRVFELLVGQIDPQLDAIDAVLGEDLPKIEQRARDLGVPLLKVRRDD